AEEGGGKPRRLRFGYLDSVDAGPLAELEHAFCGDDVLAVAERRGMHRGERCDSHDQCELRSGSDLPRRQESRQQHELM
ncbi:MAG: hypothetical protein WBE04_06065, partial [Methyloceanibacter sp.]